MSHGSSMHSASRKGFTLLELMVVIVLITIMAVLVIPDMKGSYEHATLRSVARKLSDAFAAANGQAITINELHRVSIDPAGNRYALERPRNSTTQPPDVPGGSGTLEKNISVKVVFNDDVAEESQAMDEIPRRNDAISFYPDGTCDSTDVVLRDRQGFQLVLRLNPITSRVQIVDSQSR